MKILIMRVTPNEVNLNTYNLQEVGLAKALVRKGHECDVMYYCEGQDHVQDITFDDGKYIRIIWLHGYGMFYEGIYPSLRKYISQYDIIQVGGYVGIMSCWLNLRAQNKVVNYQGPYYCEENQGDIKKAKIWDRTLLPLSNKKNMVVATKSVLATEYIKGKGIDNVTTIGVGLDLDNILRDNKSEYVHEFVQELQQNKGNGKYLLYIGVLEERRNIHFLLDIFKLVNSKLPESRLVIIGKGKSEYVESCFEYMDTLEIRDKIIYRERLEQKYMKDVYQISDAFLLPTRYEIFGMVLLEAMYFGLPVFTTYNGGSSTLITEENGIVIDNYNKNLWGQKILDVLTSEEKWLKISKNAHKTIAEHYTWDAIADEFLKVYQKRLSI